MKYTIKEKYQILRGTHPDCYPAESTFSELSPEEQREANRRAAEQERIRQTKNQNERY